MHQETARRLKFRIKEEEELYCLCREGKGADQLGGDREANLRLCSRKCKCRFSHVAQLSINLLWRIGSFNEHKKGRKQGNNGDIARGIPRKVLNIFKTIFE